MRKVQFYELRASQVAKERVATSLRMRVKIESSLLKYSPITRTSILLQLLGPHLEDM